MRSFTRLLLSALLVLPAVAMPQTQDVPLRLGYQGRLLASDGAPLTGVQQVTFTLYGAPTGTNDRRWSETQQVALTNGWYATFLGATSPLGASSSPDPAIFTGSDLYLAVEVGGRELSPRQRIGSVAYAMRAARAVNADYAAQAGAVDVGWLSTQSVGFAVGADHADHATNVAGGIGAVHAATVDAPTITAGNLLESKNEVRAASVTAGSLAVDGSSTLGALTTRGDLTAQGKTTIDRLEVKEILHVRGAVVGGYSLSQSTCNSPNGCPPTTYSCKSWGDGRCAADNRSADCRGGTHSAGYMEGVAHDLGNMTLCIQH